MDYNNEVYINDLVDRYKEIGSEELKSDLVFNFSPYFIKYASIVCGTKTIDLNNKDTLKFLRLFMTDEERFSDKSIRQAAKKYVRLLRKIFSDYTSQDIYDEMQLYFLEALEKYKPMIADHKRSRERISFTHYIQVNLRYKLKGLARIKSRDALCGDDHLEYSDLYGIPQKGQKRFSDDEEIDLRWIHGKTTGDLFKQLTRGERYLLWLKYESSANGKELSSWDIVKVTGLHHKTILYKLNKIREKLEGYI